MNGRRLPDCTVSDSTFAPGDYMRDTATGHWFARPPGSHLGSLERHEITEHENGTITVSPSILIDDGTGQWHGYLERGEWRRV